MEPQQVEAIGNYLRAGREAKSLSLRQLEDLTDIPHATIVRIEKGQFADPSPDKLARLAEALELPVAEVLAMADIAIGSELPTFQPYMRSKYKDLPDEALEQIERYVTRIARKHGVALRGPAAGEDE